MTDGLTPRAMTWKATMPGFGSGSVVRAHDDSSAQVSAPFVIGREEREQREAQTLRPGATLSQGAGHRMQEEEPDGERTCFERDRDRIVHSAAFRRLAGKTQVVVFPRDHERTRLTHAIEVAQVATSIARGVGVNVTLADAIALGHDCGHGPGGHASEDAFDAFLPGGYDHGPWGADVVLAPLNLCLETLDGIRNHSWSRPAPHTVEGEIVSWADRIAYCAHDLEDAVSAGIVRMDDLPSDVVQILGPTRRTQLRSLVNAVINTTLQTGTVGMDETTAAGLANLRAFNYERIYTRPESVAQSDAVIAVLQALVEYYAEHPQALGLAPDDEAEHRLRAAVTWVAGMTDRFAFHNAITLVGYDPNKLPKGIGRLNDRH